MAKDRKDVPQHLKWRVEDIFASQDEWEATYKALESALDFSAFEGKLRDPDTLLAFQKKLEDAGLRLSRLYIYAAMRHDEDTRDDTFNALLSRIRTLAMRFSVNTSFATPELTALPAKTLRAFIADPRFADYDYMLKTILRNKPHVLSKECEMLLAQEGKVLGGFQQIFTMIDNADFPFPTIRVDGKDVRLTHGTYGLLLHSPDRRVRRAAFRAYYKAYIGLSNTLTAAYGGNVEKDVFLARARGYENALAMAMDGEDVDVQVYKNLLDAVSDGLPLMHRYFADRKKILGVRELHMYDVYTSLVEDAEMKLEYEDAFRVVKKGLAPLGKEYQKLLDEAHEGGWIDVEETDGKRSGAYSNSVYGLKHPYVLLNYQKMTSDVFTIAHELGHAMHSYFSERSQPQAKADYTIFVAEVASTVNEVLLFRHLLAETKDVRLKKYLLSYYMDMLKGTLFRQTQFAEFEFIAHDMAEKGEPLTKESLCRVYGELNRKYYGPAVVSDEEISYEWSRIPHFYRSFYVYKYATGIISAVSIAERILTEGERAVQDYFRFLSSGGSSDPVSLLRLAGVDLMKKDAFTACMKSFENALREFESLE